MGARWVEWRRRAWSKEADHDASGHLDLKPTTYRRRHPVRFGHYNFVGYSEGARRDSTGAASSAPVGRLFRPPFNGHTDTTVVFRNGYHHDTTQTTTAFAAELYALQGAVTDALLYLPRGSPHELRELGGKPSS